MATRIMIRMASIEVATLSESSPIWTMATATK